MSGTLLLVIFLLSLAMVVVGWSYILRLAFRLEKQRFGWADEEALTRFLSLRRPRGPGSKKRMQRYIREDLRDYAEATGQAATHRKARLMLAAGYAGSVGAVFAWFAAGIVENW